MHLKLLMKNILHIKLLLFLLPAATATKTNTTTKAAACKHVQEMWGDPNPNIFYICNAIDQTPLQFHCPEGRGFFNGHGYLGCLPYAHWPACLPKADDELNPLQLTDACNNNNNSVHLLQPWATVDPNKFYMCPGIAATPLQHSCAPGKGFVQTTEIVGCADWLLWRSQMQCEAYY